MRNLLTLSATFASLFAGSAFADEPIDPYTGAPVQALPATPEQPIYQEMPPQPAYPVTPQPYVVGQQPGYYYPPTGYSAPMYSYPPPPTYYVTPVPPRRARCGSCCAPCATAAPRPHVRWFSIGARLTALALDQQINNQDVVLGGAGLQLRLRTRGRFAFEGSVDFLHGSFDAGPQTSPNPPGTTGPYFHVGNVTRDSIPVALSLMLYIFPNQDERVFNLYFLGGLGAVNTTMGLTDENGNKVKQQFTEFEGHLGVGAELRFRWIALQADVRGLALTRDDKDRPGSYYSGVDGGPVPANTMGVQGNVGATLWF